MSVKSKIYNLKSKISFEILLLIGIILLGAFLRLYRISDYMLFLGDEGRDVLVIKRLLVDHQFTLLGPITSVGSIYLGPIYYYLMAPFLWLFRFDPVGPAIMVALFSLATIFLLYKFSAEFLDKKTGLIAGLLYAVSPLVINHSHSSWNPNVLPFFSLLIIYGLAKIVSQKKDGWLLVVGLALGVAMQLHYLALVFLPIILGNLAWRRFHLSLKSYILGFFGWLLTFSPFLIFEIRHQFPNTQTVLRFITAGNPGQPASYNFGLDKFFLLMTDISLRLFWRLITIESETLARILALTVIGGVGFWLWKFYQEKTNKFSGLAVLAVWYLVGVGVLSFYRGAIYDYYLAFLFPLPFLLTGFFLAKLLTSKFWRFLTAALLVYLVFINLKNTSILRPANKLVTQTKEIARFVLDKTEGQPYNFALIALHNSDHAYRYFLEIWGQPPVVVENSETDPQRKTVTEQLLIVCEEKECKPLGHPLWEIAGFGRAEIENEWQVGLVKIFKLSHYKGI